MRLYEYVLAVIPAKDVNLPKAAANQAQLDGVVNGALAIAGIISVLFIIIGGFRYVTSQGNSDAVRSAREMIIYSLVGLIMVIFAFAIVQIVIRVVNT